MRIHIIGAPGSGKTTLAQQLAQALAIRHIELDALYWRPQWRPTPQAIFQEQVAALLQERAWIIDGSYDAICPVIWQYADLVIWLDYPRWFVFQRLLRRSLRHVLQQTDLWGTGNRQTLRDLCRMDSILWSTWQKHRILRRYIPQLLASTTDGHLTFVHLHAHCATQRWFAAFTARTENFQNRQSEKSLHDFFHFAEL